MILEITERSRPKHKSRPDMFLDEFSLVQSADLSRAPIPMGWRVDSASGLLTARELKYESNPIYGHQVHIYRTLRAAERIAQKRLRRARKALLAEALRSLRQQCTSTRPVIYYRKQVDWVTLPVRKQEKVIIGTRLVTRKQLLHTISYKKLVVWYEKVWLRRKRGRFFGLIYKKRRRTKWVTLTRKVWRIYRQTINVRGLNKWVIVAWRRYPWTRRIPTVVGMKTIFDRERYESMRSQIAHGPEDPRLQPLLDRLRAAHSAVVAQAARLKAFSLPDLSLMDTTTRIHIVDDPFYPVPHSAPKYTPVWVRYKWASAETVQQHPYLRSLWYRNGGCVRSIERRVSGDQYLWHLGAAAAVEGQYIDYMPPPRQVSPHVVEPDREEVSRELEARAFEAALSLKSGRVDPYAFNLFRSVGELKDVDQTISTLSATRDILKGNLTSQQRALADQFRTLLLSGKSPSDVRVVRLQSILRQASRKVYLSSAAAVAGWYCMSKFALAPTAQDIATVFGQTFQDLTQIRRSLLVLSNLRNSLGLSERNIVLRQPFGHRASSEVLPQDIRRHGAHDIVVEPMSEDDVVTDNGIYSNPNARYAIRLVPIGAPGGAVTLDAGWTNDDFSSAIHTMQLCGADPLPDPTVSLSYDLQGLLWAPLAVDYLADLVGSESTALRRLLQGEQRSIGQLVTEVLDTVYELVGNAFTASRWLETTWELVPLSFIVDWAVTTRQTVSRAQRLLDSLFGDLEAKLGDIWCRVAMRNLRATAQMPSYFLSNVASRWDSNIETDIPNGMSFSLSDAPGAPASVWTPVFRFSPIIRLTEAECYGVRNYDARGTIPLLLDAGLAKAIRFCRRGPYIEPPALRKAGFLLPRVRVSLNGGKIFSVINMLLSRLG